MKQAISREKVAAALKQEELGVPVEDIIREMGVSLETYLDWRRSFDATADMSQFPESNIKASRTEHDED
jgi:putative transposase